MASKSANRQKRHAARKREGLVVVPAVVLEVDLIEMLRNRGYLTAADPSRQQLVDALSRWLFKMTREHTTEIEGL